MYVIKAMRINKFMPQPIVSNRALFVSKGDCSATTESKATSDCFSEPTLEGASKTKVLGLAQDISAKAIAKAKKGDGEPDMPKVNAKDK